MADMCNYTHGSDKVVARIFAGEHYLERSDRLCDLLRE